MNISPLSPFSDVYKISPKKYVDKRGFFIETYNKKKLNEANFDFNFIQDNHSRSNKGVLRGIHFQKKPYDQGKLVRVSKGSVYDVAVDLRRSSKTFGLWAGIILNDKNHDQLFIPSGFGHAFLVLENNTDFAYKVTNDYSPDHEGSILWNDTNLDIQWPFEKYNIKEPVISEKDKSSPTLLQSYYFD